MKTVCAPIFVLAFSISLSAVAHAVPPQPGDFHYCADLPRPLKSGSFYQVHLAGEIIEKCSQGCGDIRLFSAEGKEIPYVILEQYSPDKPSETYELEITSYSRTASSSVITLKPPEKSRQITLIDLEIPDRDFNKRVVLSGSSDGKAWRTLAEDRIYDFSSQVDLRKTKIEFKKAGFRYYRLALFDRKEPKGGPSIALKYEGLDFSVNGMSAKEIKISKVRAMTAAPRESEPVYDRKVFSAFTASRDKDGNTVIVLAPELPADRISLDVSNSYFYRTASVYSSETGREDSYALAARAAIYRFPLDGKQESREYIDSRAPKGGSYKIVIENRNNPPLDVKAVTFSWARKNLYFIALSGDERYSLCFGNILLSRPDYDLAHFITARNLSQHAFTELAARQVRKNSGYAPKMPGEKRARIEKYILTSVVILLVIGMGYWLYTLMRKISPR